MSRPPLLIQLRNFVADAIKVSASGFALASEEERETRMATCVGCTSYQDGRCNDCGCFVAVKIAFEAESCPAGKWGKQLYATADVIKARVTLCESCDNRSGRRCKGCNCNVYHITQLAPNVCPLSKWKD